MTEHKERLGKRLMVLCIILLVVELVGVAAFLLWRKSLPQTPPVVPTTTVAATVETTEEEIIWDIIADDYLYPDEPELPENRFSAGDFDYRGDYLTCVTEPCVMGIDVSSYQGEIDWEQVKAAGFEFVMIRVGGRGYGEEGYFFTDRMADAYYKGAKAAGLQVGAYFFSQAVHEAEALEEAQLALKLTRNWELDLPLAYDWEFVSEDARTAYIDMWTVSQCTRVFCDAVKEAGRKPMVYLSLWFGRPYFEELIDYPIWLALYTDEMTYPYPFDMWQYTCTGTVPGIQGDVDINIYFPPAQE